jgi:hypothetical protein
LGVSGNVSLAAGEERRRDESFTIPAHASRFADEQAISRGFADKNRALRLPGGPVLIMVRPRPTAQVGHWGVAKR